MLRYSLSSLRGLCGVAAILAFGAACSDSTGTQRPAETHVRIVNSVYQGATMSTATPHAIDFLIDSLTAAPSAMNVAVNTMATADSANGYRVLERGVHSFVARRAGDVTAESSLYTTSTNKPFLPRLFLGADAFYTIIVAGIIPPSGDILDGTVPFILLADDPFPGPRVGEIFQARFRVINAAPYADPSGGDYGFVNVYVTPGSTPPADPTTFTALASASYRGGSAYMNVNPGTYVISLVNSVNEVVLQQAVTFAAGEVRTLILQNTSAGAPTPANHVLRNVLDHQYE